MAPSDDDQVAGVANGQFRKNFFVLFGVDFIGFREAIAVGEGLAIVDDDARKSGQVGDFRNAFRDMTGAKDERARLRNHRLDEDAQLASADQPIVIGGILAKTEVHLARPLNLHHFARGIPNFRFDAAAADGPEHRSVFADQQLGAFVAGNGSIDLHDSGEGAFLAQPAQADDFLVDIHSIEL